MDDGRDGGRAALGVGVTCGWGGCGGLTERPVDGDGAAEAVEPLLFVEDIVDLQRVRLRLTGVL